MEKKAASGGSSGAGGVCLQIIVPVEKEPKHYQGPYCHPDMHPKNYKIADSVRISNELAAQLESRDMSAHAEIEGLIRERGLSGDFILQINRGGPGRRGTQAMLMGDAHYSLKSRITRLGRIRVSREKEEDDDAETFLVFE
jgi:hypothetical protein